jgi:hypothetical protein
MSEPPQPPPPSSPVLDGAWVQVFWKIAAGLILLVLFLLIARLYRIYLKRFYPGAVVTHGSMVVSNQQAQAIWGDIPGVAVVAGTDADNVYRPATKIHDFGPKIPEQVPELQDAMLETRKVKGDGIVVAERASISLDPQMPQASPYILSPLPFRESIV